MAEFIERLFDELRPAEGDKDRVIMGEEYDLFALHQPMHPFFVNQYISPDALERSHEYYEREGQMCAVCGDLVTLPVEVGGKPLPFVLPVTKRDAKDRGLPTIHPQCEIQGA